LQYSIKSPQIFHHLDSYGTGYQIRETIGGMVNQNIWLYREIYRSNAVFEQKKKKKKGKRETSTRKTKYSMISQTINEQCIYYKEGDIS
jgi:hypothetical protein